MSYLDRVLACNAYEPRNFRAFRIDGRRVGSVTHAFAERLAAWPDVFRVTDRDVTLDRSLATFEARTAAVDAVVGSLVRDGALRHHGERYAVTISTPRAALMTIDRGAAAQFGIRTFGQHLTGLVRRGGETRMWIARRAQTKPEFPGRLDNLVAGGLPYGRDLVTNLIKECDEEATIPRALAVRAVPVGAVSYCRESDHGLTPEILYCYDLELPPEFQPRINDGEVEAFYEWSLDEVAAVVRDTAEFKLNCDLVIIDFLIRHGYLGPDEPGYLELVRGLRAAPRPDA